MKSGLSSLILWNLGWQCNAGEVVMGPGVRHSWIPILTLLFPLQTHYLSSLSFSFHNSYNNTYLISLEELKETTFIVNSTQCMARGKFSIKNNSKWRTKWKVRETWITKKLKLCHIVNWSFITEKQIQELSLNMGWTILWKVGFKVFYTPPIDRFLIEDEN